MSGPSHDKTFEVVFLRGRRAVRHRAPRHGGGRLHFTISAADGGGTLAISGGNEQDGIELDATAASLSVGDAGDVRCAGSLAPPGAGSDPAFTIPGRCAA